MLFFVIGLPGRFTEWCAAVSAGLAERVLGAGEAIEANTLEQISRALIRRNTANGAVCAMQPGGRLRAVLAEAGTPFVLALDDPRRALVDLVGRENLSFTESLARVASSCAAVESTRAMAAALPLFAGDDGRDPAATAAIIGAHLAPTIEERVWQAVANEFAGRQPLGDEGGALARWDALTPDQRNTAEGALAAYLGGGEPGVTAPIRWGPRLFRAGDGSGELEGPIDLTGRARCLADGPGILLMPGDWTAALTVRFSPEATDYDFLAEIHSDRPLASATFRPPRAGSFTGRIDFTVDDSADQPISIRISTVRAAFDGTIALGGVTLMRAGALLGDSETALAGASEG